MCVIIKNGICHIHSAIKVHDVIILNEFDEPHLDISRMVPVIT